jgi:hypothetical protein
LTIRPSELNTWIVEWTLISALRIDLDNESGWYG